MTFKPMNLEEGCKNFRRMFISDELYIFLAKKYAHAGISIRKHVSG